MKYFIMSRMKHTIFIICLLIQTTNSFGQGCNDPAYALTSPGCPSDGKQLVLVFEDNFDNQELFEYNWMKHAANSYTKDDQWLDPNQAFISGGTLKLYANNIPGYHEPAPNAPPVYYNYTGSQIYSRRSFGIGAFEIKCKIPHINRGFPAFWLFHYDLENPCWQEIDVFEFLRGAVNGNGQPSIEDASSKVKTTWHKEEYCDTDFEHPQEAESFGPLFSEDYSDGDWHTFKVEWNGSQIITYVNDHARNKLYRYYHRLPFGCRGTGISCEELGDYNDDAVGPIVFPESSNPMHILVDMIIQESNNPTLSDNYPLLLEVEYIKAWQFADCNETIQICGNIPQDYPSIKVAGNITAGGNCNVVVNFNADAYHDYNFSVTELLATDEIALLSGFEAHGSEMTARIVDCQGDVVIRSSNNDIPDNLQNPGSNTQNLITGKKIILYPNPNSGEFFIELNSSTETMANLYVVDISGRVLYTQSISLQEGLTQIQMSRPELPAGIYFIKVDGFDEPVKIIITK